MAVQVTISNSFFNKIDQIKERKAEALKERMQEIATFTVSISPVDTGAYITSHSINGFRSRSSRGKPSGQAKDVKAGEALGQLMADIEGIDFETETKYILRNRSPHSSKVENLYGYAVYSQVRNVFG